MDEERFYRVLATMIVPRSGTSFILREGKVISSCGYDIPMLRELGVKLEQCDAPAPMPAA